MILHIKLHRPEIIPWGFRLTGGAEFEAPLTVTKITENSVAGECGIKVGDVIVEINGVDISEMSHQMVHELITGFTDTFVVGLKRDGAEQTNGNGAVERPASEMFSEISEATVTSNADSITQELEASKISEEHIAEIISGESEVLKDHNVIGINFQRIIPKANIFKSSEVFKHLNEEAMKSRADKLKEVKRWTTFLQKPNRPIPKPKSLLDAPYQEPYRVRIVKQPRPACDPNHVYIAPIAPEVVPTEESNLADTIDSIFPDAETEQPDADATNGEEAAEQAIDVEDDDVPDLMDCPDEMLAADAADTNGNDTDLDENISENGPTEANDESSEENTEIGETVSPTLDPVLGKQLADVQQQLEALSHLPSTIQATLETITKQIADIMPALQMRASIDWSAAGTSPLALNGLNKDNGPGNELISIDAINNGQCGEQADGDGEAAESDELRPATAGSNHADTTEPSSGRPKTPINRPPIDMTAVLASNVEEQVTKLKIEKCFEAQEEAWEREKKEKDAQHKAANGDKHQMIAESVAKNARNASRYNGPRTPQERPLVLPGGRKWRNPKDAYNEEFIAEVISSQAELITGSTLGNIDEKYFEKMVRLPMPFDNAEYELRISGTVDTDQRVMSFIDPLWGFEVTGGADQHEPLTILDVKGSIPVRRSGYGFRAGIRKDDIITRINDVYADSLTLHEAQMLIRKSGKAVQIFVLGDYDYGDCFEYTTDLWFKPKKRFPPIFITNKWPDKYNWNDHRKPLYRESNCYMVPSTGDEKEEPRRADRQAEEEARIRREQPIIQTESDENKTEAYNNPTDPAADAVTSGTTSAPTNAGGTQ